MAYGDRAKLLGHVLKIVRERQGRIGAMNAAQEDACQRGVAGSDAAHEK